MKVIDAFQYEIRGCAETEEQFLLDALLVAQAAVVLSALLSVLHCALLKRLVDDPGTVQRIGLVTFPLCAQRAVPLSVRSAALRSVYIMCYVVAYSMPQSISSVGSSKMSLAVS